MKPIPPANRRKTYAKALDRAVQISNPDDIIEPEIEPVVIPDEEGEEPLFPVAKRVWKRADGVKECRVQVYIPVEDGRAMEMLCVKMGISHSAFMRKAVRDLLKKISI